MKRICKNCFLSATALKNFFCRLNGQAVKYPDGDCQCCITEDDVKAAKEECFLEKVFGASYDALVKPIPVPPKQTVVLWDLVRDQPQQLKDIYCIKLGPEKLHFEEEQLFQEPGTAQKSASGMITFLCENCGEYVLVPAEGVGRKVHWKCRACHQENCFEVDEE
jgi:hypothetical protein